MTNYLFILLDRLNGSDLKVTKQYWKAILNCTLTLEEDIFSNFIGEHPWKPLAGGIPPDSSIALSIP